jgi:hypothetical protein
MIAHQLPAVIFVSCWLCVTTACATSPVVDRIAGAVDSEIPGDQPENVLTLSQIVLVIAVVVLVLLVLVLIAGFFTHAVDTETPEQKLERKLNQQELGELAKSIGVYYATTEALKKLK